MLGKKILSIFNIGLLSIASTSVFSMQIMDDAELSNAQGQALLNLTVTQGIGNQSSMGFYRLGVDAEISLNANIKKLQLGCGGSKGSGCDIDIDNISLVGLEPVKGADGISSYANSDFVLNNPFIEFAIDNPNSASTRQISGFRLGALSALGMMMIGSNNDTSKLSDDTGINSLSGDIGVRVSNAKINDINLTLFGGGLATADSKVAEYNTVLDVSRSPTFDLLGMTASNVISIGGLSLDAIELKLTANMKKIPFATVHNLIIADQNGNPSSNASLSLQSKDIYWQDISTGQWKTVAAKSGWWMSLPSTQFENLNMDGSGVNLRLIDALGGILGATVDIAPMDLGQIPSSNCFGGHKFC